MKKEVVCKRETDALAMLWALKMLTYAESSEEIDWT